jgi:hypothetical protein
VALGWTRGRRDSTHGTWVSRHALSWRRARRCRCTAAGKLEHVRRAERRRRDGGAGGAAAAGARGAGRDVGVWPHVCMRRRARIRVQARASKPARAWVSACSATTRRNDSTARNVHAHATLGTPGGCAVRRHAALPWDTPGCGDMLRHLGILPGALARNKNAHAHATLGTPGGCAVRRHAALPWDTPGSAGTEQECTHTLHLGNSWGLCSGGDMPRHLGMLLGALADRSRDSPGGTGCPQQRCEYTGRLHMQGDTRTRCLGNSWVRCGELRNRRCDVGLLQRSAQSEHASASWQNV